MKINVFEIMRKKGEMLPFQLSESMENTEGYPDVVDFLKPVKVEGTLTNSGDFITLEGKGTVELQLPCDRCLKSVNVKVNFNLKEKFSSTGSSGKEEMETFSGESIDISEVVRRAILAGMPMKVLCQEDCKGLCPMCGKDLNEGDCGCDTSYINPKFESLLSLFQSDEEV